MSRKFRLLLTLLAVFALIAAACGDDDAAPVDSDETATETGGDDAATDDDSAAEDDAAATDDDSEAEGGPITGGTLVIGTTQVARHVNGLVQSGLATAVPGTQIFASPLRVDADFNFQPYLAETWEVADDGLSVTLNLVDNATFHDGMPVTSADVAFSILTSQANHPFKTMFEPVTSVDTPDDFTVVINLSQPHPAILLALTPPLLPVVPKHIFDDGQDMATHPRNMEDVVGSGPFKLVEFNPAEVIRLERNDDFFLNEGPYFDEIILQTFPDENTLLLEIEAGTIDMSALSNPNNITRLLDAGGRVVTNDGHHGLGALNWVEFNLAKPPLDDVRVRQAIALAIDRDFITDALHQGIFGAAPGPIAPSSPFFNEGIETYDLDIDAAKALLADAGFADGDISLEIDYIPGPDNIQKNVAEYIIQAVDEIGIEMTLNQSADFPTWAGRVSGGDHDLTMNNVWNWGDPVIGVHRSYLSTNRVGVIWTNNTDYENTTVDTLLADAAQATDVAARRDIYVEFQDALAADVPIYWLNNTTFWQTYPENLMNPPSSIWGQMSPMNQMWFAE